jgi:cytochrome c553
MLKCLSCLLLILAAVSANAADISAGKAKAQACAGCHGADGISVVTTTPSLAAQPAMFIVYQLIQYRGNQRASQEMNAIAATLSDADMRDLGAHYASLSAAPAKAGLDAAKIKLGQTISEANHCQVCHTPDMRGQKQVPRLAGQHVDYLKLQLKGLRDGTRKDIDGTMASAAQGLSDADIDAVSVFAASLGSTPGVK